MIETVFIEGQVAEHPNTKMILKRLPKASIIEINRYQEIFNKRQQSFRLQKKNPALILAKKHENFVLSAPSGFGMESQKNYYFSHMFNCIYDCRYCFLQGMYSSANYLIFVNYEDFFQAIIDKINKHRDSSLTFFSGYDCDSLAFENISGFARHSLDVFADHSSAELELRTKSININPLLKRDPIKNCIVAFSLSPKNVANILDIKAPSVERRIKAIHKLTQSGWLVGLRFDPLIFCMNWEIMYSDLISAVMKDLDIGKIHSVSFGPLRYPKDIYKRITELYPDSKLLSFPMQKKGDTISYGSKIENLMSEFIQNELIKYLGKEKIFHCIA
mgnify:CR=1 FL=1